MYFIFKFKGYKVWKKCPYLLGLPTILFIVRICNMNMLTHVLAKQEPSNWNLRAHLTYIQYAIYTTHTVTL